MKLAALVPLNSGAQAKTRLAGALDPRGRAELARWLARRVLDALHAARVSHVAVISPDDEVLRWAWQNSAQALRQHGSGLNAALDLGRAWALRREVDTLLVALGDLPLLTADDIRALVGAAEAAPDTPSVTIAPDRADQGTNLLLLRPPTAIPFAFGVDSLARHSMLARDVGIEPGIVRLPGAAFDVDTPADLRELAERGLWAPASTPASKSAYPHRWAGEAS
jgi:2-phospho-L-lactate guanylyltransferase